MPPTCIFVTGPAHSGTRLFIQMFDRHPDVSVPMHALNPQGEFRPWNPLFFDVHHRTPLHSDDYQIDRDELRFTLDAYMLTVDASKPWFVLKIPYDPLICMDVFTEYFEGRLVLLYAERPVAKIVRSYARRGEDRTLFLENAREQIRQVKRLPAAQRQQHLAHPDMTRLVTALVDHYAALRDQWNAEHPALPFITVDMEQVARSREYLVALLEQMGLATAPVDAMRSVIDTDRLLHNQHGDGEPRSLKQWARSLTPPLIWNWAARRRNG